jgi:hypothetical protein
VGLEQNVSVDQKERIRYLETQSRKQQPLMADDHCKKQARKTSKKYSKK